jgi:hypothetical protein
MTPTDHAASGVALKELHQMSLPEPGSAEPEDSHDSVAEPEAWPEAGPEWEEAYSEWRSAWPLHVYLFAIAFLLVSVVALYIIASIIVARCGLSYSGKASSSSSSSGGGGGGGGKAGVVSTNSAGSSDTEPHHEPRGASAMEKTTVALMLMVLSFSLSRCLFLLLDPYFSRADVPFVLARLLFSLGVPGLTASFSILLLILLDTTRLSLGPPRFRKVKAQIFPYYKGLW